MKRKIIKIIGIVILLFMIIIISNITEVEGKYLNDINRTFSLGINGGITENADLIIGTDHIFCIEQGKNTNWNSTYRVKYYVKIDGKQSNIYYRPDEFNTDSQLQVFGTANATENAKFAYIISQEDPGSDQYLHNYADIQKEVYGYISTWLAKQNITDVTTNAGNYGTTNWDSYATNYANKLDAGDATITDNTKKENLKKESYTYNGQTYTKAGPFNFTYTGSYTSSKVYNENNNEITVKYASYSGTTLNVYDNIKDASTSGSDFYILVPPSTSKIGRFTATVSNSKDNIVSHIWILKQRAGNQNIISTSSTVEEENSTDSIEIKDIELTGNLSIIKEDLDTSNKMNNVEFIIKNKTKNEYIKVTNGTISYVNKSEASKFTTDSSGQVSINNLEIGTYEIYETKNERYGYANVSFSSPVLVKTQTITSGNNEVVIKNTQNTGNLQIVKKDYDSTSTTLSGVTFVIKASNGKYIKVKDTTGNIQTSIIGRRRVTEIEYTTDKDKATKFVTDDKGTIILTNILTGTYTIEETSVGNNYGYSIDNGVNSWETNNNTSGDGNTITIVVERQTATNKTTTATIKNSNSDIVTVKNRRVYIKIKGYVWEDIIDTKQSVTNGYYKKDSNDTKDKLLKNVTVNLKNKKGEIVKTTTTNGSGEYIFEDVLIDNLSGLYVEFNYNGMSYEAVIKDTTIAEGSKATEGKLRSTFNSNYTTITKGKSNKYDLTYSSSNNASKITLGKSTNLKYGYNNAANPINGVDPQYQISANTYNAYSGYLSKIYSAKTIRDNAITEISNINLGLKEREQPDLAIVTDLYSSKVNIKGETFTYLYGDRLTSTNKYSTENLDPTVRFENERGKATYTRHIYASDIKYTGDNKLEVKLIYGIRIYNQATNLTTTVNKMVDYFDTKYDETSVKVGTSLDNNGNVNNNVTTSKVTKYNDNYSKIEITPNITIEPQKDAMLYIELIVKPSVVDQIINPHTEVKLENIAEITSYSTKDAKGNTYGGIDKDSQPENANPTNIDTYEDDTDKAPGVLLQLQQERAIQGTVFEDLTLVKALNEKRRYANGKYDNNGNRTDDDEIGKTGISEIKVEVRNSNDNTITNVYDQENKKWVQASTTTDAIGNYYIGGLMPGEYYITFTWGGKTYTLANNQRKYITVQDYKGTIVDKEDYEAKTTNKLWYKDVETRYSDAIDNYQTRQDIDNEILDITYNKKQQMANGELIKEMTSTTPIFKVNIEYPEGPINAVGEYEKNTITNIDFGITRRPKQTLELDKKVKHIKLVLANGNCLIDADVDENGNIVGNPNYITYIPAGANSSAQIKLEIDNEIVQGATLELNYELVVSNTGEIDYSNKEYYYYGKGYGENANDIVKLSATEIIDYLDNEISSNITDTSWKDVTNKNQYISNGLLSDNNYIDTVNRIITTDQLKNTKLKPGESSEVLTITTSKLLANNEETFLENHAEIIHVNKTGGSSLTTTPGNYIPGNSSTNEVDNANAEYMYIVPPTGLIDSTISYVLLAISTLSIVGVGIILIKRFIIK